MNQLGDSSIVLVILLTIVSVSQHLNDDEASTMKMHQTLVAAPKQQQQEHMRRFHGMDDAKEIWEAIRTRFGGNANSKKMQKAVFKQQFEAFTISSSEGLEKGYDRFQQLLSQLEAHGAEVSTEDANHKFLRSLPPAWSNLAMTMRTKPDVDTLSIDDLYNNLRVFEQEIQGASKTFSSAQNVAFVSQSKSSTNKVKSGFTGAYSTCTPSTSSTNIPEKEALAGFADEVIYSLFAKQSEDWDLLHEDLEQIDDLDIEEMDINWQIAMIAIHMKKFYKKTRRRVRVDGKAPVEEERLFSSTPRSWKAREESDGLVTMDDGIVNWGEHTEYEETNHALMAISSSSELGDQEAQILAYSQAVKKLEAQLVTFQKQQLSLNEKVTFQGPQEPEPSISDDRSSEYSTCQSNDNAGSIGTSSEHSVDSESEISRVPQEMYVSKPITTNEKGVSAPKSKEVEPSCVSHIKTPRQSIKDQETHKVNKNNWNAMMERELGEGYSFTKKKCFVCGSLNHLIKDCDYYENKMAREAEFKKQRVFNTDLDSQYLPGPQTALVLKDHREIGDLLLRPQQVIIGGTLAQTPIVIDHPLKNMEDRGIFDSGCSGHMTGNKDHLDDFEECKGGSVTFGGSKGYIEEHNIPVSLKYQANPMQLEIFHKSETGIFDEASYDKEGVITDFNNLPTEIEVWVLVDLPHGMKVIGTKWVYGNKRDERGVVVRNKARLVAQGYKQKSCLSIDTIDERFTFSQPPSFVDHDHPRRDTKDIMLVQVYVDDIIFGSTKKSWCDEFEALMKSRFQMSSMGELTFFLGLQVKQNKEGIFISQDKYVAEILKKFNLVSVKTLLKTTIADPKVALTKDEEAVDVDVHLYRSMIGSLMYLTASRPDIMFAGKPNLGLWYPRESPFDLEAFSDSDYGGSNLDRKSTTGGCQFLGQRLISWQCKKQTIVATSTTEAEYIAAANCCG
ncbi:putative ribonuclease H-like domain-containing protein [Tanacetum coccineum]